MKCISDNLIYAPRGKARIYLPANELDLFPIRDFHPPNGIFLTYNSAREEFCLVGKPVVPLKYQLGL